MRISETIDSQRHFFREGKTLDIDFRIRHLGKLRDAVLKYEKDIHSALKHDLGKSDFESYVTETGIVLQELKLMIRKLRKWAAPRRVRTSLMNFPSKGFRVPEPFGLALVISPWNYPVQLLLNPLAGALAAGNCTVLKPSELAEESSRLLAHMISDIFPPEYVSIFTGGKELAGELLDHKFDYIFFTGGTDVGRIVMRKAAENLTPLTLELGGKSPCIVDADVDIDTAARRICWGKFINAGQTCVAPDYIMVHADIRGKLIEKMKKYIEDFFGSDPLRSPDFPRIINRRHFDRLADLLEKNRDHILFGGAVDPESCRIAPVLFDVSGDKDNNPLMKEEIFGPLLPVLSFTDLEEALLFVNTRPKPLALYYFSRDRRKREKVVSGTSSGGICINDTLVHFAESDLPFGGVGESGMGSCHGRASFDTFTHYKSVMCRGIFPDIRFRYPPFRDRLRLLKLFMR